MPRDNDKNNASPRGRRDRQTGGKGRPAEKGRPAGAGRSGAKRGPEKKFAKRAAGPKPDGERRAYAGKSEGGKPFGKKPSTGRRDGDAPRRERRDYDDAPRRSRDEARPARFNRDDSARGGPRKDFRPRDGERKFDKPRGAGRHDDDRSTFSRGPRKGFGAREDRGGEKRAYAPRGEGFRKDAPRKDFGSLDGERKFDKPRYERPREERGDRPRFDKPRHERPREDGEDRAERPTFRRPREDRKPSREGFGDRPRRDNEDDSKVFAKRPAFGGRGAYRERKPDDKRKAAPPPPRAEKSGERIAKLMARAGLASRRDAEAWVTQGRVTVNGRVINSPALDVTANDVVLVDGKPLPERERTRLFLYHKPRGLMTTHADPEGRPTVFDHLPEGLPRLISVGRLDFNTEGLLLLTNDGGLARVLELPDTGWLRRYRARAHGEITQAQLDGLRDGVEVEGVKYGAVEATLERDQGSNVWITIAIREGKNREVRNILASLGLEVNRLIRVSYGPFQLGELAEGQVEEVKTRVLREQLGERVAKLAGADFARPEQNEADGDDESPHGEKPFKPKGKSALIADRKGRRVLVQRTGSEEARARNEEENAAYGPPRRVKRGYHGKRDLKPRDE